MIREFNHRVSDRRAAYGFLAFTIVPLIFLFSLLGSGGFAISGVHAIPQLSDIPLPTDSQLSVVGDSMIHNGRQLSIATYESALTIEDSVKFYQREWAAQDHSETPGLTLVRNDHWVMISRLHQGYNTVIQLRAQDPQKSQGFASIMRVEPVVTTLTREHFPGLELLSQTRSNDATASSLFSVYSSAQSIDRTAAQCLDYLKMEDWTVVSEHAYQQSKVYLLNRRTASIELVVSADEEGGALLVLNEVGHGA